jgi:hypothetical protein
MDDSAFLDCDNGAKPIVAFGLAARAYTMDLILHDDDAGLGCTVNYEIVGRMEGHAVIAKPIHVFSPSFYLRWKNTHMYHNVIHSFDPRPSQPFP